MSEVWLLNYKCAKFEGDLSCICWGLDGFLSVYEQVVMGVATIVGVMTKSLEMLQLIYVLWGHDCIAVDFQGEGSKRVLLFVDV